MKFSLPRNNKSQILFAFFLFSLLGWLLYSHDWNTEFHWDDYHLIRSYSNQELIQVWSSSWDPDNIEVAGFRPFTTYFNHLRYTFFGEYVYGHRLFLVVLNALMLVLFMLFLMKLSFSWMEGFLAGLLYLVSPSNFYHIAWLSDGIHISAFIFGILGIFFAIKASQTGSFHWYFLLAHFFGLVGLLSREENISMYLILLFSPYFFTPIKKPLREHVKSPIPYHVIAGFIFFGIFLSCRVMFAPEATSGQFTATGTLPAIGTLPRIVINFFKSLLETLNLLALMKKPHLTISILALTMITCYGLILGRRGNLKVLLFLFFALVFCLLPTSYVYRTNLLLPPTLFAMAIVSFSMTKIYHHMPRIIKVIGIVAFVFMLVIMARENYIYQENLHPLSLLHVHRKGEMLFYWKTATIPQVRREKALSELKALGLLENPNPTWNQFRQIVTYNVMHSSLRRPDEGKLFRPLRDHFYR